MGWGWDGILGSCAPDGLQCFLLSTERPMGTAPQNASPQPQPSQSQLSVNPLLCFHTAAPPLVKAK